MTDKTILTMNADFKKVWDKVILDEKAKYDAWTKQLQEQGVKCAMPDDGWVNRQDKCLHFAYPTFQLEKAPIEAGYLVALGWPDKYRLVKLTGRTKKRYIPGSAIWWYYTEVE